MDTNGAEGMQNKWIIKTKKEIRVHSCSFVAEPSANEDADYKIPRPYSSTLACGGFLVVRFFARLSG
jgi:hypothetical protein